MKYYKLDRDTKAYLKRMAVDGIKTPADIYSVNDFIVGLKDLSLYSSVEEMWLLRSSQNVGTGSTVYAFKNNIYNAVITSAVWTFNGLFFGVNGSKITMSAYKFKTSPFSCHLIDNTQNNNYSNSGFTFGNETSYGGNNRFFYAPGGNREFLVYRDSDGAQLNLGSQNNSRDFKSTLLSLVSSNTLEGYYGTTYKTATTNANFNWDKDGTTLQDFTYSYAFGDGSNPIPTTSSIIIFNESITSKYLNYYSLYKATIGKGLGLA
jgi:hypothetical protein